MKAFLKAGLMLIALFLGFGHLCYTPYAGALDPPQNQSLPTLSGAQLTRAKQLFKEKCARCHGADGRGQTAMGGILDIPNFASKAWWKGAVKDERLIESVRNGKGGMPKFGKKLSGQDITLLVTYLRRFNKSSR